MHGVERSVAGVIQIQTRDLSVQLQSLTLTNMTLTLMRCLQTVCALFAARDAMHKRGLCRHAVSVCVSVCLSRSWIVSKRVQTSSKFFHHRAPF